MQDTRAELRIRADMARKLDREDVAQGLEMALSMLEAEPDPMLSYTPRPIQASSPSRVANGKLARHCTRWRDHEEDLLRTGWAAGPNHKSISELSQLLDRSTRGICERARRLGLPHRHIDVMDAPLPMAEAELLPAEWAVS